MVRSLPVPIFVLSLLVAACSGDPTTPTDKTGDTSTPDPTGTTDTGTVDTVETGTTDTGPDLTCEGDGWLPGGFWDPDVSITGPSMLASALAVDAAGSPVLLLNELQPDGAPGSLTLRWREATDPDGELPQSVAWAGIPSTTGGSDWLPLGQVLEETPEGAMVGGQLSDGVRTLPFAARIDRSTGAVQHWVLDDDASSGSVTAGPVFTSEGSWWLGEVTEAGGVPELVVWRIDASDVVTEAFRYSGLSVGAGATIPGALAVTDDGSILVGGGVRSTEASEQRALLFSGGVGGFAEILSLPPTQTGGVPGAILAAEARADRLTYAWGSVADPIAPADTSWRLYDGSLSDPASAALVDEDAVGESATPMALSLHTSGAVFASGGWVRADGKPLAPYVRMGIDDSYSTTFAAPGPNPGWINEVEITDDGLPWALCVYSSDGISTDEIVILRMVCLL